MSKVKIAILGSCVTRDAFNSKFNTNYKEIYEVVATQFQSSIITLMSAPIPFTEDKISNLPPYAVVDVKSELSKEFLIQVKKERPDYFIIDFWADNHFGVVRIGEDQYVTNNRWRILLTPFYKELKEKSLIKIEDDESNFFTLWRSYVDKFCDFICNELPETKVILHKARNVKYFIDEQGVKRELNGTPGVIPLDVDRMNVLWEKKDDYFAEKINPYIIDLFRGKSYDSFSKHPWNRFYVHYTLDYYLDFITKLNKIIIDDLRKENERLKNVTELK